MYLIFTHIPKLPPIVPQEFVKDYMEYVNLGNIGKIHLANVLAKQFTEASVGPGAKIEAKEKMVEMNKKREREQEENKVEKEKVGIAFNNKIPNYLIFFILQ